MKWKANLSVDKKWQDQHCKQKVCHSQTDDEVVGGGLQSFLFINAETDEHVSTDDGCDE